MQFINAFIDLIDNNDINISSSRSEILQSIILTFYERKIDENITK